MLQSSGINNLTGATSNLHYTDFMLKVIHYITTYLVSPLERGLTFKEGVLRFKEGA